MAYSTLQDVEHHVGGPDHLRSLSDWTKSSTVGSATVQAAIAEADAWIDAHLSKRFDVPVADVPTLLVHISAAEAGFVLKRNRSMVTESDMTLHEERRLQLEGIANGKITIGTLPLPAKSELLVDRQSDRPTTKQVSRERTKGYW